LSAPEKAAEGRHRKTPARSFLTSANATFYAFFGRASDYFSAMFAPESSAAGQPAGQRETHCR
jgi:hypothetical protein